MEWHKPRLIQLTNQGPLFYIGIEEGNSDLGDFRTVEEKRLARLVNASGSLIDRLRKEHKNGR